MMITNAIYVHNCYCANCKLKFGGLPDVEGNIRCPLCGKSINKNVQGVARVDRFTYHCHRCNLLFSAKTDELPVVCPNCSKKRR